MAHLKLLLLPLWVGVTVSMVVDLHKRIIGGQECLNNERQHHVKLLLRKGGYCGGSLIDKQWVLTAAHCWDNEGHRPMTAVLGLHPRGGQSQTVQIAHHVTYRENGMEHDLMLLKLSAPSHITPVALPDCKNPTPNKVQIAGYGPTGVGPNNKRTHAQSDTLQCAMTDVVDCLPDLANFFHEHLFCGQRARVDSCPGDSGGGAVYNNRIYGVIALAYDPFQAFTAPILFIDVCRYIGWIENTIHSNK